MHATDTAARPPQTEPALRAIAMPADANPHGDMSWWAPMAGRPRCRPKVDGITHYRLIAGW